MGARLINFNYRFFSVISVIAILLLAIAMVSALTGAGYFSIDEVTYHLMVKNLSDGHFYEILNGYHEFQSPAFNSALLVEREDFLVAQYPAFYAFIAFPFYWLFGLGGLFILNALCFVGVLTVTYAIAEHFSKDKTVALLSCFLLGAASFLADYAIAAWPHAVSCLCLMIAFWSLIKSGVFEEQGVSASSWLLLSGAFLGIALGLRYDAVFMLPVLALPLLLQRPFKIVPVLALALGVLPSLILLSISNWYKFEEMIPFSYGRSSGSLASSSYLPFLFLAIAGMLFLVLFPLKHFKKFLAACCIAVFALLLFSQTIRSIFFQLCHGGFQLLVDFRIRDLDKLEPALTRGPTGSMIYLGSVKKSLLQSLPWFPLVFLPLIPLIRSKDKPFDTFTLSLYLPIACFIVPYAFFAWHGGMSLNLRYWIPMLPFVAIITASAWTKLFPLTGTPYLRRSTNLLVVVVLIATFAFSFLATPTGLLSHEGTLRLQEIVFLNLPLVLSGAFVFFLIIYSLKLLPNTGISQAATWLLFVSCVTWSIGTTFFYDLPRSSLVRKVNYVTADMIAPHLNNDSLLITDLADATFGVIESKNVRIANPTRNDFADFNQLAKAYLEKGTPVYALFSTEEWERLSSAGYLEGLGTELKEEKSNRALQQITVVNSQSSSAES